MDGLDSEIIGLLRKDAKVRLKKAARKLNVPTSTLHARIQKLEEDGILRHYSVEVDWKKMGYDLNAYVLVFVDTTKLKELRMTQKDILKQLRALPYVESADIVTGDADLIAHLRAKDSAELGRLLTEGVQNIAGVIKTKTLVSLV